MNVGDGFFALKDRFDIVYEMAGRGKN